MGRFRKYQPRPYLLAAAVCCLLLLAACGHRSSGKLFNPSQVNFTVEYNSLFDGQLYPAILLSANQSALDNLTPFSFHLTAPADNCVVRLVIDSSALNYVTIMQEILPKKGQQYTFHAEPKWKYDVLRRTRQPRQMDLTFSLFINDEEVDIKNLRLNCRSVNECPLSLRQSNNQVVDFRWLFAAYVNEDHPQIENILSDVLSQGNVSRLSGYQGNNTKTVQDQVFALWYYALDRGITYSSISCTSNPSSRANVQHIRFFDEVYSTRQANCVDACVLFASLMRMIGLKPIIFVEPCHAYLGYYTDKNRKNLALLETTITSWVNFPALQRHLDENGMLPEAQFSKISRYLSDEQKESYRNGAISFEQLKHIVARSLFDIATEYDQETYQNNRDNFADTSAVTYQQLDIEQLRNLVQPIQ